MARDVEEVTNKALMAGSIIGCLAMPCFRKAVGDGLAIAIKAIALLNLGRRIET